MLEKQQERTIFANEINLEVERLPRISVGVENMFFSQFVNKKHLIMAKSKLISRIMEIDSDGSRWEILTEKECNKRHRKHLVNNEISTIICEEVGERAMTYLFAIKGPDKEKEMEYQEALKWREVYSVL